MFPPSQISNFFRDDSGQDLIEYALVCALIALAAVAAMRALSSAISSVFASVGATLTGSL